MALFQLGNQSQAKKVLERLATAQAQPFQPISGWAATSDDVQELVKEAKALVEGPSIDSNGGRE
jgi:hypothetical protein